MTITTGATWYRGCPGKYGNLCDGGLYYAELGEAGANAHMGGLLGKALGKGGPLAPGTKLAITYRGKTAIASKRDVGSGQLGDRHYTIDLHQTLANRLGVAGSVDVQVRLADEPDGGGGGANTVTGGTGDGGGQSQETRVLPYEFSRGSADKRETSWDAIGRLADEVAWRRYMDAGTLVFVSDDWLSKQPVAYRISEDTRGVIDMSFDFETRRTAATASLRVQARRWSLHPGDLVELVDQGPADGPWLIGAVRRSITSQIAEVQLVRKGAKLPEPAPQTETVTVGGNQVGMPGDPGLGATNIAGSGAGVGERVYAAAQKATSLNWSYSQGRRNENGQNGYADCSSGVAWVLREAGASHPPWISGNAPVSGAFMNWGEPGFGSRVTVCAHGGHVFMLFHNFQMKRFDTGGNSGGRLWPTGRGTAGFAVRHPPGG